MTESMFQMIVLVILGVAALWDVRTLLIPNFFPMALAVLFAVCAIAVPLRAPLELYFLSFAVVAVVVVPLFYAGALGGGDVKLMAATALWFPFFELSAFLFWVSLVGFLLALPIIVFRRLVPAGARTALESTPYGYLATKQGPLPYGLAIFVGTAVAILFPHGMVALARTTAAYLH